MPPEHPRRMDHNHHPEMNTGEPDAGKLACPVREKADGKGHEPRAPRRRPISLDGRELETGHHRPWPPQWDNLPGNRGNTRLRDLPSIHVHAPAPDPTVWLYHRFPLSFREVEEMMLQRGIILSHETVRQWCAKFGQTYANALRRRRARPGDKWHLDEVFIKINGTSHYLWRAVDQHGNVLDILVTSRRDAKAATRFFRKLLTGLEYVPR